MTVRLSLLALQDLQGISNHTLDRWGEEQEELYLNTIYDLFEEISAAPHRWRYRHNLYPECQSELCQNTSFSSDSKEESFWFHEFSINKWIIKDI